MARSTACSMLAASVPSGCSATSIESTSAMAWRASSAMIAILLGKYA
jgi:hypothetical protein